MGRIPILRRTCLNRVLLNKLSELMLKQPEHRCSIGCQRNMLHQQQVDK
jgi:hypothetical protein